LLCGQNPVEGFERKLPAMTQKIGDMRLAKARLPRQQGDAQGSPLHSSQQLYPEPFVHLREIHLWKIRHRQWDRMNSDFCEKSKTPDWAAIPGTFLRIEKL
jgi:hypothetical protein